MSYIYINTNMIMIITIIIMILKYFKKKKKVINECNENGFNEETFFLILINVIRKKDCF